MEGLPSSYLRPGGGGWACGNEDGQLTSTEGGIKPSSSYGRISLGDGLGSRVWGQVVSLCVVAARPLKLESQ